MNIKWIECRKRGTRRVSEIDVVRGGKKLPTEELQSRTFRTIRIFFFFVKHANEANDTRHTSNRIRNKYCKWTHFKVDLSCCRCGKHFILFDSRVIYVLGSLVSKLVFSRSPPLSIHYFIRCHFRRLPLESPCVFFCFFRVAQCFISSLLACDYVPT